MHDSYTQFQFWTTGSGCQSSVCIFIDHSEFDLGLCKKTLHHVSFQKLERMFFLDVLLRETFLDLLDIWITLKERSMPKNTIQCTNKKHYFFVQENINILKPFLNSCLMLFVLLIYAHPNLFRRENFYFQVFFESNNNSYVYIICSVVMYRVCILAACTRKDMKLGCNFYTNFLTRKIWYIKVYP